MSDTGIFWVVGLFLLVSIPFIVWLIKYAIREAKQKREHERRVEVGYE